MHLKNQIMILKEIFYLERYISAHSIMISFEGIPALYFNSCLENLMMKQNI